MSRRGRIANAERSIAVKLYLPESLWTRLQMEVWDPLLLKARYGEVNKLLIRLLRQHFEEKTDGKQPAATA